MEIGRGFSKSRSATFRSVQTIAEIDASDSTRSVIAEGLSTDRQPSYAPDGSRVLFTSNRSGNLDLFSYAFSTMQLTQLTENRASDWDGAYTPDGRSILWSSDRGRTGSVLNLAEGLGKLS